MRLSINFAVFSQKLFQNVLQEGAFYGTILVETKTTKGAQSVNKSASPQPKKTKRIDGEALIAIFLLALTVFLVFTVSILTFRSCANDQISHPPAITTPTPADTSKVPLTNKPYFSERSQTVSFDTSSQYIVLTNGKTGEIVASRSSGVRFSPASMTKVMTLIVMCERLSEEDLNKTITFTHEMYDYVRTGNYQGSTNHGIDPNDEYKIIDLLYGIGLKSASDCVLPVVLHLAGTEERFVSWMNEKVEELELENTHFDNPVGNESQDNYTTAEDMSQIMEYAMKNQMVRSILSKEIHQSTAAGYSSTGEFVPSFPITFYSSLFGTHESSRMYAYEEHYKTPFKLQTAKLLAGKTGYLVNDGVRNHCLVLYVKDIDSDDHYILVVGGGTQPQYVTMEDIKNILDTYVK